MISLFIFKDITSNIYKTSFFKPSAAQKKYQKKLILTNVIVFDNQLMIK